MPTLTVLIDNEPGPRGLASQHGLALWLDCGDVRVLVDTGRDGTFLANADALGVDVATATHLVLSHGHYDHTGGVPALLATGVQPATVMGAGAWGERRSVQADGASHPVGIPWERGLLADHWVDEIARPTRLAPSIWTTGYIPNRYLHGTSRGLQRLAARGWEHDEFPDEQALVLVTTSGLVVITGCCHRGVRNTLLAAQEATGVAQVYALIGGLHLHDVADDEVRALAEALRPFGLQHLWVNHCTGAGAFRILRDELGDRVQWAYTGFQADLPPLVADAAMPSDDRSMRAVEFDGCYVCGPANPSGLQVTYHIVPDGATTASWCPDGRYQGFRGIIHGGLLAAILDEGMAKAALASGVEALTCDLRLRLRRTVTPGMPLTVRCWVAEQRGRRIATEGMLTGADGTEVAHAWGVFLALHTPIPTGVPNACTHLGE